MLLEVGTDGRGELLGCQTGGVELAQQRLHLDSHRVLDQLRLPQKGRA
jgi:hypothetical protein